MFLVWIQRQETSPQRHTMHLLRGMGLRLLLKDRLFGRKETIIIFSLLGMLAVRIWRVRIISGLEGLKRTWFFLFVRSLPSPTSLILPSIILPFVLFASVILFHKSHPFFFLTSFFMSLLQLTPRLNYLLIPYFLFSIIKFNWCNRVDGGYVDKNGVPLSSGGGTLVLGAQGSIIGPGGQELISDDDGTILIYRMSLSFPSLPILSLQYPFYSGSPFFYHVDADVYLGIGVCICLDYYSKSGHSIGNVSRFLLCFLLS